MNERENNKLYEDEVRENEIRDKKFIINEDNEPSGNLNLNDEIENRPLFGNTVALLEELNGQDFDNEKLKQVIQNLQGYINYRSREKEPIYEEVKKELQKKRKERKKEWVDIEVDEKKVTQMKRIIKNLTKDYKEIQECMNKLSPIVDNISGQYEQKKKEVTCNYTVDENLNLDAYRKLVRFDSERLKMKSSELFQTLSKKYSKEFDDLIVALQPLRTLEELPTTEKITEIITRTTKWISDYKKHAKKKSMMKMLPWSTGKKRYNLTKEIEELLNKTLENCKGYEKQEKLIEEISVLEKESEEAKKMLINMNRQKESLNTERMLLQRKAGITQKNNMKGIEKGVRIKNDREIQSKMGMVGGRK